MTRAHKLFGWLVLLVAIWLMSGCGTLSLVAPYQNKAARNTEYTWLAVHAIDTAQTVTIARSPSCLRESDPIAAAIYHGEHPSTTRVVVTNVVLGYAHYRIGGWIDYKTEHAALDPDDTSYGGWYLFRAAWHGFALIGSGYAVAHNARAGVGPLGEVTCK